MQRKTMTKSIEPKSVPQGQTKFPCTTCNKSFTSRSNLRQHTQLHTGQFSYYCKPYKKGFNNCSYFKEHVRSHEGLTYQCNYCSKQFASKKNYSYHLSIHTGQYRFTCETCNEGFNNKTRYERHEMNCQND